MSSNLKQFILLVDADVTNQESIQHTLQELNVEVVITESTEAVAELVLLYDFALIIFAVDSVDLRPIAIAIELNHNERTWFVPIVFQACSDEDDNLLEQCYDAGGIDFLMKPIRSTIFLAKVKVFLELDERQQQLAFATAKIQEQNLKLEERAIRDSLTGLYNHNHLLELLAREVSMGKRYNASLSAFLLDLDFFKDVNDTCGHPFGDSVLREFSDRVKGSLRQSDILGRYGGEEFMVILPNTDAEQAEVVAEKIRNSIASTPFSNKRYERYVTVSIGVYSGFGEDIVKSSVLVDHVDNALYQAKADGRNRVVHSHQTNGVVDSVNVHLHDMIDLSQQSRLNATIEKARAMTLASFEAMVHSQTREYDILVDRNAFFIKVLEQLAKELNLPDKLVHSFRRAIKIHDLFRCYIHDSSLETEGPLSKEQESMLFDQPLMLRELTTMFDFFASERVILYGHHEHYDGSGYPDGLKGHEIPMAARIFTLIDSFVAMVAPVGDEDKKTIEEAKKELQACTGSQFDPVLVKILLNILEENNEYAIKEKRPINAAKE